VRGPLFGGTKVCITVTSVNDGAGLLGMGRAEATCLAYGRSFLATDSAAARDIPTAAIRSLIGVSRWYAGRIREGYRKAATDKMMQDLNQCALSSRSEIRRQRWELSSNVPTDPARYAKLVAESRGLRTTVVHVRPGEAATFEALAKDAKTARDKASPPLTAWVPKFLKANRRGGFGHRDQLVFPHPLESFRNS